MTSAARNRGEAAAVIAQATRDRAHRSTALRGPGLSKRQELEADSQAAGDVDRLQNLQHTTVVRPRDASGPAGCDGRLETRPLEGGRWLAGAIGWRVTIGPTRGVLPPSVAIVEFCWLLERGASDLSEDFWIEIVVCALGGANSLARSGVARSTNR